MNEPRRGEVWWGGIEDLGRRPFLVMTRSAAIPVLNSALAVPVTRTVRNIPTEVALGPSDGMPAECAATFDNLRVVPKAYLVDRICALGPSRLVEACTALRAADNKRTGARELRAMSPLSARTCKAAAWWAVGTPIRTGPNCRSASAPSSEIDAQRGSVVYATDR